MSAMHAGVMTTSTEMMYAQLVTLTKPLRWLEHSINRKERTVLAC